MNHCIQYMALPSLFRRLCLVNIAVMAIAASNVVVAEGIEDARNALTQIWWRVQANNVIEKTKLKVDQGQIKEKPWFIDKKYDESIKKVIGKAIADCVTNMNEFKDKDPEDVILFRNTNHKNYTQSDWNTLLLYNYINTIIKSGFIRNEMKGIARGPNTYTTLILAVERIDKYYDPHVEDYDLMEKTNKALKTVTEYIDKFDLGQSSSTVHFLKQKYKMFQSTTDPKAGVFIPKDLYFEKYDLMNKTLHRCTPSFYIGNDNQLVLTGIQGDMLAMPTRDATTNKITWRSQNYLNVRDPLNFINDLEPSLIGGLKISSVQQPQKFVESKGKWSPFKFPFPG